MTHSGAVSNEVVTGITGVHCSAIEAGVGEVHIETNSANWRKARISAVWKHHWAKNKTFNTF